MARAAIPLLITPPPRTSSISADDQAVVYEGIEKQPPERRRQVYSY